MYTNLIILGAGGRMGSTLIRLAANSNDLTIAAAVEPKTRFVSNLPEHCVVAANLEDCIEKFPHAVIIDFTSASSTMENAKLAARYKNPLVIGTTGLNAEENKQLAEYAKQTPIMMSPNMSVGINVLVDMLPKLTAMLGADYDTELMEIHHNLKKDAPSGTALRLAEAVAEGKKTKLEDVACYHREGIIGERPANEIGIQTLRGGDVVGVHTVYYMGAGERIEITHHAHSRENFAGGALRAARWLAKQEAGRLYSMHDVLKG